MQHAADLLNGLLRDGWVVMAGLLVMVVALAILAQFFRAVGSSMLGASLYVSQAISSVVSLVLVALFAFIAIPAIVHSISTNVSSCGTVGNLGGAAASVYAGISALRMMKAAFSSVVSAMVGSGSSMSFAFQEAAEVLFGMTLISVAIPVAAAFFGAC